MLSQAQTKSNQELHQIAEEVDYQHLVNNLPKDLETIKVKSIKPVGKKPVYEITVDQAHSYTLANGVIKTNTGLTYSSDQIFFVGKSKEKEGTDVVGYTFTLNVEKSRHIKEGSKIRITVKYDGGIDPYTGLLEIAQATGHVVSPSKGWYSRVIKGEQEDRKWRSKDTSTKEFWDDLIHGDPSFDEGIGKQFKVAAVSMTGKDPEEMTDEELFDEMD